MGRGNLNHYGNLKFRQIIDEYQHEYEHADKNGKTSVALKIVHVVKRNGGRFLKKDKNLGWIEETDEAARYRVSHRFRNMRGPGPGSGSGSGSSKTSAGTNACSGSANSIKRKNPVNAGTPSKVSALSTSSGVNPSSKSRHAPDSVSSVINDNPLASTASTVSDSEIGGGSIFGIQLPSFSRPGHRQQQEALFSGRGEHDYNNGNSSKRPRGQQQYQQSEDSWADNNIDGCFFFKSQQPFGALFRSDHQNMVG